MRDRLSRGFSLSLFRRTNQLAVAALLLFLSPSPGLRAHPEAVDVTGSWDLTLETQEGTAHPSLTLKQEGEKITGTYQGRMGDAKLAGTVKGNNINFTVNLKFQDVLIVVTYTGTVNGDTMKGTARFGDRGTGTWSAQRRKQ